MASRNNINLSIAVGKRHRLSLKGGSLEQSPEITIRAPSQPQSMTTALPDL